MTPSLALHNGLWWPADDTDARGVITADCAPAIAQLLTHFTGRDLIVQAGANVGTYPLALAKHFASVVTCEPDPTNWECLRMNLAAHDPETRVTAIHAAFGAEQGGCLPIVVHPRNCGAHRVSFTENGSIPVWTIDGLGLTACDAIWLDVEGAEFFALCGAVDTIERFSPIIACEDKGLDHQFFGVEPGSLQRFLSERRYVEIDRIGRDKIYRRTP